jgi:hypothetical protein
MSDTRARVPEPEFPPGPAAPTACTVPGVLVAPRPPASLGLAPSPAPRPGVGSRVHCGEPQAARGEGCPRGTHCVGATAPGHNPTSSSIARLSRALQCSRTSDVEPPWTIGTPVSALVLGTSSGPGFPRLSGKVAKGGCGTSHRAPRPQKTSPSVVILGTGSRYSPRGSSFAARHRMWLPPKKVTAAVPERPRPPVVSPRPVRRSVHRVKKELHIADGHPPPPSLGAQGTSKAGLSLGSLVLLVGLTFTSRGVTRECPVSFRRAVAGDFTQQGGS